jgi:hypothetical protein
MLRSLPLLLLTISLAACSNTVNPSFNVSVSDARDAVDTMEHDPVHLKRPIVLIGGFLDPDVSPSVFRDYFESISVNPLIIRVPIGFCTSFDQCRQDVIAAVDAACPPTDPIWTQEVDVVGASLGGLVARYCYTPSDDPTHPRRLKIAHLFTISSPNSGAKLAEAAGVNDYYRQMQPGSPFLMKLAAQDADAKYQLFCYTYLEDDVVGADYAAPPGQIPYWLTNKTFLPPHWAIMMDPRILGDIGLRLRGEQPFTHPPPAPFPQ